MPRGNPGKFRCIHPKWFNKVKVGDVIARSGGRWRVVRRVNRRNDGSLYSITVTIQRCSWTHRCYTILNFTDLRNLQYRLIPNARIKLKTRGIDAKINKAINQSSDERPYVLSCCDVIGAIP